MRKKKSVCVMCILIYIYGYFSSFFNEYVYGYFSAFFVRWIRRFDKFVEYGSQKPNFIPQLILYI